MEKTYNYSDFLCRTCMDELHEASSCDGNPKQQWQSIYDRIEDECSALRIAELLSNAVPQIEVQPSDELPKIICYKCLRQLLSVHRFQQMCVRSEEQMRQQVSKKRPDLEIFHSEISIVEAATVSEIKTIDAVSFLMTRFQPTQDPLIETTEQVVELEPAETSGVDLDKLLEDCKDSLGNFCEFIKNEPIEDDEQQNDKRNVEDSDDGDTIPPVISVKDKVLAMELEEQPENETNVKTYRTRQGEHKFFECPHCPLRFSLKGNMLQHKATHNEVKRVACDICGKSIAKIRLKHHKLIHSDDKPHKCDFCEKSFVQIAHLLGHMGQHIGEKPYKCNYCERVYDSRSHLMQHLRAHLRDRCHTCDFCPLTFNGPVMLHKHLKKKHKKALKEAENKSQNLKPHKYYECPYCPLRFRYASSLFNHKRIHEGVHTRACDICGKMVNRTNFNKHKLLHSNEKVHKCDFCKKSFAQISYLRSHIRTHTGEKPFKCKYCECTFAHQDNRKKHMRIHLGDNVHRCRFCPLAFPSAAEMRLHFTTHKNEDSETRERNMKALKEAEAELQLKSSKNETQQPSKEVSQQQ